MDELRSRFATTPEGIRYCRDWADVLQRSGLLDFDRVMALQDVAVVKHAVPERSTCRFALPDAPGVVLYLKRYTPLPPGRLVREVLGLRRPCTAMDEFENILAFAQAGLPTVVPLAAGLRQRGVLQRESFLLTLGLQECRRVDELIDEGALPAPARRALIGKLAALVRAMHEHGMNHRDLYLCHVLRHTRGDLFIVDLHRLQRRPRVPGRWKVKDLAALNYAARNVAVGRTDRLRFFKRYCDAGRLGAHERALVFKIVKKTRKMIEHNDPAARRQRGKLTG